MKFGMLDGSSLVQWIEEHGLLLAAEIEFELFGDREKMAAAIDKFQRFMSGCSLKEWNDSEKWCNAMRSLKPKVVG